jgi:hypothetical protein
MRKKNMINNSSIENYQTFTLGRFTFRRDEYFAYIHWPQAEHIMPIDQFLRALMRDVAWGFFYGTVNFDSVFGTVNYYGSVEVFAGKFNAAFVAKNLAFSERFDTDTIQNIFNHMLKDWTPAEFDPFAAPRETSTAFGKKKPGENMAIKRNRETAKRMVGMKDDSALRTDANGYPVNEHFADVPQDEPQVVVEPGFEGCLNAFNLFAYLSRSNVTWNPSITSVLKDSLFCPTTEEYILPVIHGNDRVEWFIQLSDEIIWNVEDKETGKPRAKVTMKAGDIAAMPADIRHQGYSPKRSMLLVWENASSDIPELIRQGKVPTNPVNF